MSGPDGQPAIMLMPLWNGDKLQGERAMEDLQAFGTPQSGQFGPATYTEMLAPFDAWMAAADGCHWETRTRWLPALTRGAVDAIIAARPARRRPLLDRLAPLPRRGNAHAAEAPHSACAKNISWWRSSPVGSPTGVTARRTGDGHKPSGKASPHLRCRAATRICWRQMIANRRQGLMAATPPGSALKRRFDPDGVFASAIPLPEG